MTKSTTQIALYDLDRTITKRPTYTPFLLHAAWRHEKWRLLLLPLGIGSMIAYLFSFVTRGRLKEINHKLLLGETLDTQKASALAESFAEATLAENIHPQAIARIEADRAEGRRIVMATASYAFYAKSIALRLGFDDVIATGSQQDENGAILAKIDGENCYAEAKLRMIQCWMESEDIERNDVHIRFYSDSPSDLPVFELSDEPVATNPTSKLRRIAEDRGWRIFAWG